MDVMEEEDSRRDVGLSLPGGGEGDEGSCENEIHTGPDLLSGSWESMNRNKFPDLLPVSGGDRLADGPNEGAASKEE